MVGLPVLDAKSTKAPKLSFKNDWGMEFDFNFCFPSSCINFSRLWSIREQFYPQLWLCLRAEGIFLHDKITTWFHESVRRNDSWCCFCRFSIPEFFRLHVPDTQWLRAASSWTKTRTLCFPSSVASMDEVIHSAPWRPWMKSSIVPVALPPLWCPWMKSSIVPPGVHGRNQP